MPEIGPSIKIDLPVIRYIKNIKGICKHIIMYINVILIAFIMTMKVDSKP